MHRTSLFLAAALVSASGPLLAGDGNGRRCGNGRFGRLDVVGLTSDQRLVCFNEWAPSRARTLGAVVGLSQDTRLVGIDYRPATGDLVGLGDQGGVYTLDTTTAEATFVSRLNVALSGTSFGVDFNPTVDRLRIVSDTGQNLRANVADGVTTTDLPLNYPAPATGVTGVAYTNNDLDPTTATTLFDIDSVLNQVAVQAPPNDGRLNPTGKLEFDVNTDVGFDIYSDLEDGVTRRVRALASLNSGSAWGFYVVNLLTGDTRWRGFFRSRDLVVDIAIPLDQR
jgi:hypothetical protein